MLKPWSPNFQMSKKSLKQMPLWVTFPSLPVQYWSLENLSRIASYFGKPVCTDSQTAREGCISYARMLIEIDVTQPLPEHLLIKEPNENIRRRELDYN